jgi:hypothetical protein
MGRQGYGTSLAEHLLEVEVRALKQQGIKLGPRLLAIHKALFSPRVHQHRVTKSSQKGN